MKTTYLSVPSYTRESYNWGFSSRRSTFGGAPKPDRVELFTDVEIEPDGTIRVWDDVGKCYSARGELTDDQRKWIADAIEKIKAGTHFAAAGSLHAKAK